MDIEHLIECSITELRAAIEWRRNEKVRIYRDWDKLGADDHEKYERYQKEIVQMIAHIDERKEVNDAV